MEGLIYWNDDKFHRMEIYRVKYFDPVDEKIKVDVVTLDYNEYINGREAIVSGWYIIEGKLKYIIALEDDTVYINGKRQPQLTSIFVTNLIADGEIKKAELALQESL